jgi:2-polyprenyl-3-methyl-5-hydroxy-6-metoxy-1,4-benzoquinol methylase
VGHAQHNARSRQRVFSRLLIIFRAMFYEAINQPVLSLVPDTAGRILDLGCGSGALGREIKRERECEVTGVTFSDEEAKSARECLDDVVVCDLNEFEPRGLGEFDCIICSHVLEHLYSPAELLSRLRESLTPDGVLIVALPNALFWKQRLRFLRGHFRYTEGGIMDRTHYRFFDYATSLELVRDARFEIIKRDTDAYFPLPLLRRRLEFISRPLDRLASKLIPGLCGTQFIIVARRKT